MQRLYSWAGRLLMLACGTGRAPGRGPSGRGPRGAGNHGASAPAAVKSEDPAASSDPAVLLGIAVSASQALRLSDLLLLLLVLLLSYCMHRQAATSLAYSAIDGPGQAKGEPHLAPKCSIQQ